MLFWSLQGSILVGKKKVRSVKRLPKKAETQELKQTSQSESESFFKRNELVQEEAGADSPQIVSCESEEQQAKKPAKTGVQRELKSLLMLSSHGNKSQKSKLKDCVSLFELLHERQDKIVFDSCDFDMSSEQTNILAFGNRKSVIKLLELEHAELQRLNSDKWYGINEF